jgi:hypothetical protein
MAKSPEARNKVLVLEAFDTLFNQRDYVAAARLLSHSYVQHGPHGRAQLEASCGCAVVGSRCRSSSTSTRVFSE